MSVKLLDWLNYIDSFITIQSTIYINTLFFIGNEMVEDHMIFIITLNPIHLVEFYTSEIILSKRNRNLNWFD